MKKVLPIALLFVSLSGVAAEFTVTTTGRPDVISRPGVGAFSFHRLRAKDFPREAYPSARIKSISWSTTQYPRSTNESAKLCLGISASQELCEDIRANASGQSRLLVGQLYQYAYGIWIRHAAEEGPRFSRPSGTDSLTITLTY
jgi:hypothetical protein